MSSAEQTNIKVIVRVRPYNRLEIEKNQRSIIEVIGESTLLVYRDDEFFFQGAKMGFDRVYGPEASNEDFFECTLPLVESVMTGYNCSVFVYGATGAGKTFTMLGSENCRGLTYLTIKALFKKIEELSDKRKFDIGVSCLEVYNEQVMNLLTKEGPLKLRDEV